MPYRGTLKERFERRVQRTEGCWYWTGRKTKDGYGSFDMLDTSYQAHRAAWMIYNGPVQEGLWVLHRCDKVGDPSDKSSRACVRLDHLYLGTHADNMRDKVERGRVARWDSEEHPSAKLTAAQVAEIRARRATGEKNRALAQAYGVCSATISNITTRKKWVASR